MMINACYIAGLYKGSFCYGMAVCDTMVNRYGIINLVMIFPCIWRIEASAELHGSVDRVYEQERKEVFIMADLNNPKVQKILQSKEFAHLATIGPDGAPQSSPMWFIWDGEYIKFTHTTDRVKYQNIKRDPRVSVSITDKDNAYTYAEFRGTVERIESDPKGVFYDTLAHHYGAPWGYTGDPRVIFYVKINHVVGQGL
jgi:PPOX class probable F420-dependent enzyme